MYFPAPPQLLPSPFSLASTLHSWSILPLQHFLTTHCPCYILQPLASTLLLPGPNTTLPSAATPAMYFPCMRIVIYNLSPTYTTSCALSLLTFFSSYSAMSHLVSNTYCYTSSYHLTIPHLYLCLGYSPIVHLTTRC